MSPVVVAAHPMETAALEQALPELDVWHFGVGAIRAAHNTHALAERCRGRDVIYIGTAGLFGSFTGPELYLPTQVVWQDYGLRCNQTYAIEGDLPNLALAKRLSLSALHRLSPCRVICSATISKTAEPLPTSADEVKTVENVELYSVTGPVSSSAKSFTALLATTNAVGPDAHQQWCKFAPEAARLTSQFLTQHILGKGG